jgi:hypothetical protein
MESWFERVLRWFSSPTAGSSGVDDARRVGLSDYERRLRELEERSGQLFLP